MNILAFATSNSSQSINKQLVTHACHALKKDFLPTAHIKIVDINNFEMPIYSMDREAAGGVPALAQTFLDEISACDAMLISYSEHNGGFSAAYKNIFDWASRINVKVYQQKPTIMMSTSPGPGGAARVLNIAVTSAAHFGAELLHHFSVPSFNTAFDGESGTLTDAESVQALQISLTRLKEHFTK